MPSPSFYFACRTARLTFFHVMVGGANQMLTPQTAIWISPENVLSLHCTGVALQQTRGCSGAFLVVHGHSAGAEGPSQTALGKNYKALGKNYKGESFIYLPDKSAQAAC